MPRAGLNAERVVARAAELADRDGLGELSLAALADQLGVRVPSLYRHVGGLPDLRRRVALEGLRGLDRVVGDAVAGRSGGDALRAFADAYRAYARAHPGRYAASLRAPSPDDAQQAEVVAHLAGLVLAVLAGYGLPEWEVVHAARGVRSALHGFVSLEAAVVFALPVDVDVSFARLLDVLDAGLVSAGG